VERRVVVGFVVSLVLAFACTPGVAMGQTLVVGSGPGCTDARYATIQSAVDAARPGAQIVVCPGTYREAVTVQTTGLKIFARKRHEAVVQPPADDPNAGTAFNLGTAGTHVRGFTFLPADGPSCEPEGQAVVTLAKATVDYNRIMGVGCHRFQDGVEMFFASAPGRVTVDQNQISGFERFGVRARGSQSAINRNTIREGGVGILVEGGRSVVQSNTIDDMSGTGIFADGFDNGTFDLWVAGNRLNRNGNGIVASNFGVGMPDPFGLALGIRANTVLDSVQDGITVDFAPGHVTLNRSLRSGRFDCYSPNGFATWRDNIGVTDSPSNLCRAP